ncbi:MAG: Fe-Mn family superoxide dismutase, partial [Vampirovibrio sp.]|nr:Fe-Mn family superoxide dismutase [Vampirovibrio sp.]
ANGCILQAFALLLIGRPLKPHPFSLSFPTSQTMTSSHPNSPSLKSIAEACGRDGKKADWKRSELNDGTGGFSSSVIQTLTAKNFDHLNGAIEGLSWNQLKQHIGLYNKYVKKLNAAQQILSQNAKAGNFDQVRTLQLKQSYALNGAVLHDLYFSNMTGKSEKPGDMTAFYLNRDFDGRKNFEAEFKAIGKSMRGWTMAGFNFMDGKVHTYGLDAHDAGTPLGVYPLLVMDVYEHAYMIDFGTSRAPYIDVFTASIDWDLVEKRLTKATHLHHMMNNEVI